MLESYVEASFSRHGEIRCGPSTLWLHWMLLGSRLFVVLQRLGFFQILACSELQVLTLLIFRTYEVDQYGPRCYLGQAFAPKVSHFAMFGEHARTGTDCKLDDASLPNERLSCRD